MYIQHDDKGNDVIIYNNLIWHATRKQLSHHIPSLIGNNQHCSSFAQIGNPRKTLCYVPETYGLLGIPRCCLEYGDHAHNRQQKKTPCEIKSWWPNESSDRKGVTRPKTPSCVLLNDDANCLQQQSLRWVSLVHFKGWSRESVYQVSRGWTNPFEKYEGKWESTPKDRGENAKFLKPPPSSR